MTEISISIPPSAQPSGKAVFVMLGTGFDEIEALAPVRCHAACGMEVFTVSMTDNRLVKRSHRQPHRCRHVCFRSSPDRIDWLIFPGADKSEDAVNLDEMLSELVKAHWEKGGNIAAICAAPALVLGPLGIINGVKATGYPFLKEEFENNGGIYSEEPVVIGDRLITSKAGTTLEFALAIVRKAKGRIWRRHSVKAW